MDPVEGVTDPPPSKSRIRWGKAISRVRAESNPDMLDSRLMGGFPSLPSISESKLQRWKGSANLAGEVDLNGNTLTPQVVVSPASPDDEGGRKRSLLLEMNSDSKHFMDEYEAEALSFLSQQKREGQFDYDTDSEREQKKSAINDKFSKKIEQEDDDDPSYRTLFRKEGSRLLNEVRKFIVEYETPINVLIVLPFVLMACYIAFVENGDLVKGLT